MNKIFFIVLLFLIALAALGGVLLSDAGYILLQWRGVAIETSAVVFTIFLLISASVIIGLFHIMMRLFEISAHFRTWRKTRSHGKISQKLNQGILDLLQENWQSASAALKSVGSHKDFDAIRLLGLANAAQGEGDFKTRDTMMQQLETVVGSKNALSVGLAHAELYSQAGQGEQAIAVLNTLHQKFPKHPIALKRLVEQYAQHAQWRELHSLLPAAKRLNAISDDQLNQYTTQYYAVEFDAWIELAQQERQHLTQTNTQDIEKQGIENSGAQRIETRLTQQLTTTMWKQIPDQMLTAHFVCPRVDALVSAQFSRAAQRFLEAALKKNSDPNSIQRYGELLSDDYAAMIQFLQTEIGKTASSAEYCYALGRLHSKTSDWTQAKLFLEKSVRQRPTRAAFQSLAEIYQHMQQYEKSSTLYQKALRVQPA